MNHKNVALVLDVMALKTFLVYNPVKERFEGLEDLVEEGTTHFVPGSILAFMVSVIEAMKASGYTSVL